MASNYENHMVADLDIYNEEPEEAIIEPETAACYYCKEPHPVDEMNVMIIDGVEEYLCITCLASENE